MPRSPSRASLGEKGSGLIRLTNQEDQLPAKDVVRKALGDDYVVALNLAQTTPQWLRNLGASPMKLGLDLSGGVHFLLEVDMDKAMNARMKVYEGEVKTLLRKERVRYRSLPQQDGGIMLGFADDATREQARVLIRKNFNDFDLTTTERNELAVLRLGADPGESRRDPRILDQAEPHHRAQPGQRAGRGRAAGTAPGCQPHRGRAARRAGHCRSQAYPR